NSKMGWAIGEKGMILSTQDGGEVWKPQTQDKTNLWGVYFLDAKTGWVAGENGKILMTVDGGKTWTASVNIDLTPPAVEKPIYSAPPVLLTAGKEAGMPIIGDVREPLAVNGQETDKPMGTDWWPASVAQARTNPTGHQPVYHPSQSAAGRWQDREVVPSTLQRQFTTAPFITSDGELFMKLEKLYDLMKKGILTKEEFEAKKAEMLDFITANEQLFSTLETMHALMMRGVIAAEEFEAKKAELLKKLTRSPTLNRRRSHLK
ncbi:MAG: SHOCT domain-containing protein, partial [Candidatus Methylumidiphilus sp.]